MKPPSERRWLSPKEVADEYGVSKDTTYRMIRARKWRVTKIGREYRVDRQSIEPRIIKGIND